MIRTLLLVAVVTWARCANALNIQLDYGYDAANGNFFGLNPTAKAAVDAAALDLGNAIVSSLGAVTTDLYSGTNGTTTATFDWSLNFANPTTGLAETLPTFSFAANTVKIYVGMQALAGTPLGQGGPGSSSFGISASGIPVESQWVGAVAAAQASSNASMTRGGGPIIARLSGSLPPFGATVANFDLDRGAMHGSLSFDSDTNNDTVVDDPATLANFWQFDHTAPVQAGKNDFYSVALHELMHSIGFGSSRTWDQLHSGTNWTGSNVITLAGTGTNMLSGDQVHIAESFISNRLSDGVAQEAAMDPSITVGTRKYLTQLDLAFLRDIGYQTIPEPSTAMLLFVAAGMFGAARSRRRA